MFKNTSSIMLTVSSVNWISLLLHPCTQAMLQQHCSQLWATAMYPVNLTCLRGSISACPSRDFPGDHWAMADPAPCAPLAWHGMAQHGTAWHGWPRCRPGITLPLCLARSCQPAVTIQDCKMTYLVSKELRMWELSCGLRYEGRKQNGQKIW